MKKIKRLSNLIIFVSVSSLICAAAFAASTASELNSATQLTTREKADIALRKGHDLFNTGRYMEALYSYYDAYDLGYIGAANNFNIGLSHKMLGAYEKAGFYMERALTKAPDFAAAHSEYAQILEKLGQNKSAEYHYNESISGREAGVLEYVRYGIHLLSMNPPNITEAENMLSRAHRLHPIDDDQGHTTYLEAHLYFASGDYVRAWESIEELRIRRYKGIDKEFLKALNSKIEDPYKKVNHRRRIQDIEERMNLHWMTKSVAAARRSYETNERPSLQ